jgi:signal peptidase I
MPFSRKLGVLGRLTASLLCGLAVCAAVAYGAALGSGYRFFIVMSGSMAPRIPTGAVVMSKPQPAAHIKVGQIITFVAPDGSARLITHRVYAIVHRNGKTGYRTKGDANPVADAWTVSFPHQVGVEHLAIPWAGYMLYGLSQHRARLLLLGLIAAGVASLLVGRLWREELAVLRKRLRPGRADSTV